MKKTVLFFVLLFLILSVFAGCNNKKEVVEDTQPASSTTVETNPQTVSESTEAVSQNTENTTQENSETAYETESDELEILTPDDGYTNETQEPEVTENTETQSEETFPGLDSIIDEPIELPFVPID